MQTLAGYIVHDAGICGGEPRIRGTRITVRAIGSSSDETGQTPLAVPPGQSQFRQRRTVDSKGGAFHHARADLRAVPVPCTTVGPIEESALRSA